ncbi:MAG: DNA polymerase III subunit gamma/tau [Alphaproteobacteria bacterium]|nr:DNA polymerase III subunit gamma/tau [Alphaproteobacteria bacterium]
MNEQADHSSAVASPSSDQAYRVLARKYRPSNFDELIGQESLVQTLTNALAMGRLAHAFVLTGLRGIGKTTTARIIARGLNCTGADGNGGPTLTPCGVCSSCTGIAEGRHVDVIEMDAASNTGVDDVREIIDGVGYRPLSARFKIYIIDEVHMLSKNAFNALLKTLEEPPEAVKFIFATTEIRKVPVTVLSRCQRFDLRRVPNAMMADHLKSICGKEAITVDDPALERLARAAEGSVRDALSLLDQAAALSADNITDDAVAGMLGQAGRGQALEMTTQALSGDAAGAMMSLGQAIGRGAEPLMVINDMLDLVHLASRLAAGGHLDDAPETEREALTTLAQSAGIARLGRAWQILLKGHGEITTAPDPHAAADMLLIRLAHAATMPTPADLVRKLEKSPPPKDMTAPPAMQSVGQQSAGQSVGQSAGQSVGQAEAPAAPSAATAEPEPEPEPAPEPVDAAMHEPPPPHVAPPEPTVAPAAPGRGDRPQDMRALVKLCEDQGELILASTLRMKFRPVAFAETSITLSSDEPPQDALSLQLSRVLEAATGQRCDVIMQVSADDKAEGRTLDEEDARQHQQKVAEVSAHPLVAASLQAFPGAKVASIDEVNDAPDVGPDRGEASHA